MAINFPANPSLNEKFTVDSVTYIWDGEKWTVNNTATLSEIYVSKSGDTMTGPLLLNADPTANLGAATKQYADANGGGGSTTINYNGASAWGDVAADGTLNSGLNSTTTNITTGIYEVTFQTPMPNADYSVTSSTTYAGEASVGILTIRNQTATGFQVDTLSHSGPTGNYGFNYAVYALNALPPKGGTGTDAWATVDLTTVNGACNTPASFNIESVTRTAVGTYDVVFTTPMPSVNYAAWVGGDTQGGSISNQTTTGFQVLTYETIAGQNTDYAFSFGVNATNAQLPDTVTQEQIESAINNPGASAWGNVDTNGNLVNGLNCSTTGGAGSVDVTFITPMPDANYAVTLGTSAYNSAIRNQTATGFTIITDVSDTEITSFAVFATNALPPRGGTGTDSWAQVKADGTVLSSFNATVVKAAGNGDYDITFVNPMPTANYAVTGTVSGNPNINYGYSCITHNQTANGFRISVVGDSTSDFTDNDFSFNVNATDATLPTSFTEEEIQAVVDLAKSGSANGASAWGSVQGDGTLNANLNIASVTTTATGDHDIVFTKPMPTADYSVVGSTTGDNDYGYFYVKSKSTTGFTVNIRDASNTFTNYGFDFTVHSTNVTLPFTVTQTQIESFKSTVTALEAAVIRIQSLEATVQAMQADHTTLMNNNGGY